MGLEGISGGGNNGIATATATPAVLDARRPVDVEDLVRWVYREQKVDIVLAGRDQGPSGGGVSSSGVMAAIGRLGCIVDTSGPGASWVADRAEIHPDAEAVHSFVLSRAAARGLGFHLVQRHAKDATRPNWRPDADPRCLPQWREDRFGNSRAAWDAYGLPKRGTFVVEYELGEDGRKSHKPSHCPITWQDHPDVLAIERAEWRQWRRALDEIAAYFRANPGELVRHRVEGPAIEAEPWNAAAFLATGNVRAVAGDELAPERLRLGLVDPRCA
jgi:hypothetical protein